MILSCEQTASLLDSIQASPCPVRHSLDIVNTARHNVCGKGTICRDGLAQIRYIISDITQNKGKDNDIELLCDLLNVMVIAADCEMVCRTAELILKSLTEQQEEWRAHLFRKRCSNNICEAFCVQVPVPQAGARRRRRPAQ